MRRKTCLHWKPLWSLVSPNNFSYILIVSSEIFCLILSGSAITWNHLCIRFFSGAGEAVHCCVVWMADAWTGGWLVEVGSRHIFSIPFPDPRLCCSWSQLVLFSLFLMCACDCLYRFMRNHCVCGFLDGFALLLWIQMWVDTFMCYVFSASLVARETSNMTSAVLTDSERWR
jgi:hypothetical protein